MIREENSTQHNNNISGNQNNMYNNSNSSNKQANENRTTKGSTSSNGSSSSASNTTSSAETQASEKLAIYVYEYLLHRGASMAAQTFLSEIQWEKNISLGDAPGFLHNWWCVFWDLYSAAPERQDPHHTPEAKAFHDLNSGTLPSPSYIPQPTSDQLASMSGMAAYYQHGRPPSLSNTATSPHGIPQGMMPNHFMNSRYAMGRPPSIRMPNQAMAGSPYSTMDPSRNQQAGPYNTSSMNPAAMRNFNGMAVPPNYNRIPSMTNGGMMGGGPMGPTTMQMGPRGPWTTQTTPSPLTPGPPRTPILSSPQDPTTPVRSNAPPFGMDPSDPQLSMSESGENLDDLSPVESTESEAIKRIKESMKEEVKKFESVENTVQEYYNMQ